MNIRARKTRGKQVNSATCFPKVSFITRQARTSWATRFVEELPSAVQCQTEQRLGKTLQGIATRESTSVYLSKQVGRLLFLL